MCLSPTRDGRTGLVVNLNEADPRKELLSSIDGIQVTAGAAKPKPRRRGFFSAAKTKTAGVHKRRLTKPGEAVLLVKTETKDTGSPGAGFQATYDASDGVNINSGRTQLGCTPIIIAPES